MKVAVFGSAGMLGKAVLAELIARGIQAQGFTHQQCDISDPGSLTIATGQDWFDVFVNCAGRTPGAAQHLMAAANALGPHNLAILAHRRKCRLLHVSTDCVFDGIPDAENPTRRYSVLDRPCPIDWYGRTKYAGEAQGAGVLVVRTSFIGLEAGLLRWFLDETGAGHEVDGWTRAFWTGSTVDAVACELVNLVERPSDAGLVHLATEHKVTKYDVLVEAARAFGIKARIRPVRDPFIDRALAPTITLPPVEAGLAKLAERWKHSEQAKAKA